MSTPKIKSITSLKNLKNKTVLVRCDFDVPLTQKTNTNKNSNPHKYIIKDDSRLRACLPTINFLLKKQVKQIILIGHLGRPASHASQLTGVAGRPDGKIIPELSLMPVAKHLEKLLLCHSRAGGNPVGKKENIIFVKNTDKILRSAQDDRKIIILENLRFNPGEEKNDKNFAKKLASLADIYVNEAFAVSHRSAASVDAIKKYLPSYAGLNLEQEIKNLSAVMTKPVHPLVLIIGGAKIETKLPIIKNFINKADYILIGGAVANNFLKASGVEVGKSLIDNKYIAQAKKIINLKIKNQKSKLQFKIQNLKLFENYKIKNSKLFLPVDWKIKDDKILDIGPQTIKQCCDIIKKAKTIIWNGPMGYFEDKKFARGTTEIAKAVFKSKARIVIGGGDTNQILAHNTSYIIHNTKIFVSTGGGAMLEFLGDKRLPGLKKIFYSYS